MRIVCISVIQGITEGEVVLVLPGGHEKMSPVELALSVALEELRREHNRIEEYEKQAVILPFATWEEIGKDLQASIELIAGVLEGVKAKNRVNLRLTEDDRRKVMRILLSTLEGFSYRVKTVDDLKRLIEIARVFVEALS